MPELGTEAGERKPSRIVSLDQFRGYTVVGMLFVNFLGGYVVVPAVFKHHNTYCSYADTIMPQFFFAVGFAYRLTFLRRFRSVGPGAASWAVFRRNLGLILLGFVIYHLDGGYKHWSEIRELGLSGLAASSFRRELFQTLVHIALASIWVLPVIAAGVVPRVAFMAGSALLHAWLSWRFFFDWAWSVPVIDGGQIGFLTWTIPLLVGSLAYDVMAGGAERPAARLFGWSIVLMALGYAISCGDGNWAAPPFLPPFEGHDVDLWTMSQRAGSVSYLTFAAGFSLAVYALFVLISDRGGFEGRIFRTYGQNALAAYIIHPMVASAVKPFVPGDVPCWYLALGFGLYFTICTLFNLHLEKHRLFLKL